jgi:hypothetical protein
VTISPFAWARPNGAKDLRGFADTTNHSMKINTQAALEQERAELAAASCARPSVRHCAAGEQHEHRRAEVRDPAREEQ